MGAHAAAKTELRAKVAPVDEWLELQREIDRWDDPLHPATFWWRDDDASKDSQLFDRLLALSEARAVPLGLAVVPAAMTPSFTDALPRLDARVEVLQHGFAHHNYAGKDEKKSEFGEHRPMKEMCEEILRGVTMLRATAADHFLPMFVPPWNRISRSILSVLPDLGFRSVSAFGDRVSAQPFPRLRQVNTHVDLIDWRGHRGCKGDKRLLAELIAHLKIRREKNSSEPTGILSHHLNHDEACWSFLDNLFAMTGDNGNARWLSPSEAEGKE